MNIKRIQILNFPTCMLKVSEKGIQKVPAKELRKNVKVK